MKAFMDDVTLIAESKSHMEQLVTCLQELFKWAALKINPSKYRSFLSVETKSLRPARKALRVSVVATHYHLLIDIVGRI